jgi:hypothetical protein
VVPSGGVAVEQEEEEDEEDQEEDWSSDSF